MYSKPRHISKLKYHLSILLLIGLNVTIYTYSNIIHIGGIATIYGLIFSFILLLFVIKDLLPIQSEVLLHFLWIGLSILVSLKTLANVTGYGESIFSIVQVGFLILIVSKTTIMLGKPSPVFISIIIIAFIFSLVTAIKGDMGLIFIGHQRVYDPNEYAYVQFLGVASLVYFLYASKGIKRNVIFILIAMMVVFIVLAASRKAFASLVAFVILFLLFRPISVNKKHVWLIIAFMTIFIVYSGWQFIAETTLLGERCRPIFMKGLLQAEETRLMMYEVGLDIFKLNPFFGSGVGQYSCITGLYSHSDYTDVFVSTGFIGGILYFSFHCILWLRFCRIHSMTKDPKIIYEMDFFKALLISIMLIALGREMSQSKITWTLYASMAGYAYYIEKRILYKAALKSKRNYTKL